MRRQLPRPCEGHGCNKINRSSKSDYCPACRKVAAERARQRPSRGLTQARKLRACIAELDALEAFKLKIRRKRRQAFVARKLQVHENTVRGWCRYGRRPLPAHAELLRQLMQENPELEPEI